MQYRTSRTWSFSQYCSRVRFKNVDELIRPIVKVQFSVTEQGFFLKRVGLQLWSPAGIFEKAFTAVPLLLCIVSSANGVSKLEAVYTRQSNDRNTRGSQFWPTEHRFPAYNSKENTETTAVSQSKQNKIKTFLEICKRKQKWGKGRLETFRTKSLFKYAYPVNLPFYFKL